MRGTTWRFVAHYLEMVAAMMIGMVALGAASHLLVDLPDRTAVDLVEMAVWMTVPMTAWMRVRGHSWRACNEMAAAMLLPAAGALTLLGAGVVSDSHVLLMLEHTVMFPTMLAAMLLRRDQYTGHHDHAEAASAGTVSIEAAREVDREVERADNPAAVDEAGSELAR